MSTYEVEAETIAVDNDWEDSERRRYERYKVEFYLRVAERPSNVVLGDVVDISLSGMKLSRSEPVPTNLQFHCVIEASLESGQQLQVPLVCRSVWCRHDKFSGVYHAGFEFIDPSLELEEQILSIIEELA